MSLGTVKLGHITTSRFILGSNPFSGFSHQGDDRDLEMITYYTTDIIKGVFRQAEELGVTTLIGRGDQHFIRILREYRNEGGTLQWLAQTCPEMKSLDANIDNIIAGGAQGSYIHGGYMDFLLANDGLDEIPPMIDKIKNAGLAAGVAGHDPRVFEWAEDNIDVDFYMCSYYNASHRDESAELKSGMPEWFMPSDRDAMTALIQKLTKPVIHYKILAAGRNEPREAFAFTAKHLRDSDAVCVGVFPKDNENMLAEDVRLFEEFSG
ncbi:hypothetical protein ACFL47_11255 [Candidatus Latescibacterota bacterium]